MWIDTVSGPGVEVPQGDAHRFVVPSFPTGTISGGDLTGGCLDPEPPNPPPQGVQADALRMILARHEPKDEKTCACGNPLGEDTGLCWYGRQAQKGLMELQVEQRERQLGDE